MAQPGTWVEYRAEQGDSRDGGNPPNVIVRPFSAELPASRSALAHGNRVVFVQWGETIDEALAREAGTPPGSMRPPRTGRIARPAEPSATPAENTDTKAGNPA